MKRCGFLFVLTVTLIYVGRAVAQTGPASLDAIVEAHGADPLPPIFVTVIGSVERGGKPEPFRLVATDEEQLRIDYGTAGKDTVVASQKVNFHDNGTKIEYSRVPSGFSQLDPTGLFLVQQLRKRAVRVEQDRAEVTILGVPMRRLRVESERTQIHKGNVRVNDKVDLYVAPSGLLAAVSRSFYEGRPERYTQSFLFSDYRKTNGVFLPYRVEVYIKGQLRQTFTVASYQFDAPPSRDLFLPRRAR